MLEVAGCAVSPDSAQPELICPRDAPDQRQSQTTKRPKGGLGKQGATGTAAQSGKGLEASLDRPERIPAEAPLEQTSRSAFRESVENSGHCPGSVRIVSFSKNPVDEVPCDANSGDAGSGARPCFSSGWHATPKARGLAAHRVPVSNHGRGIPGPLGRQSCGDCHGNRQQGEGGRRCSADGSPAAETGKDSFKTCGKNSAESLGLVSEGPRGSTGGWAAFLPSAPPLPAVRGPKSRARGRNSPAEGPSSCRPGTTGSAMRCRNPTGRLPAERRRADWPRSIPLRTTDIQSRFPPLPNGVPCRRIRLSHRDQSSRDPTDRSPFWGLPVPACHR